MEASEATAMQMIRPTVSKRFNRFTGPDTDGFTLVELLVVLAIMLIVLFLSSNALVSSRDKSRLKTCASNLAGQYVALQTWASDHDGWFPLATNAVTSDEPLGRLVPQYTTQTEFWICPGSRDRALKPAEPFVGRRISYAYYMGWQRNDGTGAVLATDEQINATAKLEQELAFSPDGESPANNHKDLGGNYLMVNGAVGKSPSHAAIAFPLPPHVTLLNPKN